MSTTTNPASPKQIAFIRRLVAERGPAGAEALAQAGGIDNLTGGRVSTASDLIDKLLGMPKAPSGMPAPKAAAAPASTPFKPTAEQDAAVKAFLTGESLIVEAVAGAGKALRVDQPVMTPTGFRPIGDLAPGDLVLGTDGLPHFVLGVYPQGERDLFNVQFSDGTTVVADADHRWAVQYTGDRYRRTDRYRVKTTAELAATLTLPGGRTAWYMPMTAPLKFATTDTPLDPWLLGVLIGDGCLTGTVTLSTADAETLDGVKALVGPMGVVVTQTPGSSYDYRLGGRQTKAGHRGFWNPLVEALKIIGLRDVHGNDKFIPDAYKYGDIETRVATLQGLFDTDGCRSKQAVEFCSTSRRLAEDVKFMVESLGGTAVLTTKTTTYTYLDQKRDGRLAYRVYIKVPTWMAPFRLSRKIEGWTGGQRPPQRTIQAITPAGRGEAMCIEVSAPDHLFLTTGCVPTHNTSTLKLMADAAPERRGVFTAFNRSIVDEAARKMPRNVECSTVHSLAYRATSPGFKRRLSKSSRMHPQQIAKRLGIESIKVTVPSVIPGAKPFERTLAGGFLASHVLNALRNFCQSGDLAPGARHFPRIDAIDQPGEWTNNNQLAASLVDALKAAWLDTLNESGWLPYKHEFYLKAWALKVHRASEARLGVDFIMVDEAQDLSPVMLMVVEHEMAHGVQVVLVGDSMQAINGFTGAVDALTALTVPNRTTLTKSFRFGQAIADAANRILDMLDADIRVEGNENVASTVGPIESARCTLSRTNALAIRSFIGHLAGGGKPHLVGDTKAIVRFCLAARDLQNGKSTSHPELACFDSWAEVQDFVAQGQDGGELALMVKLMDDLGPDTIIDSLDGMPPEDKATAIFSTAHKVKGREWDTVQLASDFPTGVDKEGNPVEVDRADLMLCYVAVTRGKLHTDHSLVGCIPAPLSAEITDGE